ncbi:MULTISPECIES: protoporphyrinogen oxidase HemJ [Helicobacter]|uniref:Protoporphyrinogen IX oxidase n=1 Tax=Helicobacter equorum TaxID=361872 RepID=A0A3D8IQX6_9HELI|nr:MULTISPECIES: protoporphyrinogen oxidase HemJ [Helicobacter]MBR2111394.1 protoporphyrinogen oxidase HemJ [Helicobacter sp.]MDD7345970.1 protoporphyrinogen oxidase HemJ [Helicobacter sp.]MDY2823983.1 protoporphyrinogen oxidase HemJ [Helicobacter sp.]PAV00167.1 TIGR00701 family protein [Helicobacter sp. TUL]RDU67380.1 protoporphyrinogen oxidase HemJ [Helicobacter equorum]
MEFFSTYYLEFKVLHLLALISWMAMLFYLPRLFVYHAQHRDNKDFIAIVKLQEQRLYAYIGMPAFVVTIFSGMALILANTSIFTNGGWFHAKLLFVVFLVIYHFLCGYFIKTLGNGSCQKSGKFFRIFNEFPTLCLIAIVIFVVIKPF